MLAFLHRLPDRLLLLIPFAILVFLLGVLTLGLGWMLFGVLVPAVALPMSGTRSAGRSRRRPACDDGDPPRAARRRPVDGMLAVVHSVLFWAGNVVLSPLILLATLVLDRKRTVHDLLLGTVVVRSDR